MAPPKLQASSFAALPVGAKIFGLVLMLALLTGGYFFGLHMGLEEDTDSAIRKHATLEKQLKEANDRQREYLRLREELSAREQLDKQNLRILPITAEIPAFLDDLNRLAELSGLEMQSVQPRPEASEQFYVRVPVALQVRGGYHQLAKFFYNISRLERAINMEDIRLSPVAQGTGELGVTVMATTFRRKATDDGSKAKGKKS
jgi:type IV pilus assembly protein PilO